MDRIEVPRCGSSYSWTTCMHRSISIGGCSDSSRGHPLRMTAREQPGLGVEIVLEVDDVLAMCQHVASQGRPLAAELKHQPWGLTDFRVSDPDGYYWRVTSRREKGTEP